MLSLLVVTHGSLAEDLVSAAQRIVGNSSAMAAVSIDWDGDVEAARRRIEQEIARLDDGDGVLVLTDMFGGTPSNLALSLLEPGRIEIVTGVNLPMLIKFTNLRERLDLAEAARRIADNGRDAIRVASQMLQGPTRSAAGESS